MSKKDQLGKGQLNTTTGSPGSIPPTTPGGTDPEQDIATAEPTATTPDGTDPEQDIVIAELQLEVERLGAIVVERDQALEAMTAKCDQFSNELVALAKVPEVVPGAIPLTAARLFFEEAERQNHSVFHYRLPKDYIDPQGDQWRVEALEDGLMRVTVVRGGQLADQAQTEAFKVRDLLADAFREQRALKQIKENSANQWAIAKEEARRVHLDMVSKGQLDKDEKFEFEAFSFYAASSLADAENRVKELQLELQQLEETMAIRSTEQWELQSDLRTVQVTA